MLAVDLNAEEVLTLPAFSGAIIWFLGINQLTTGVSFSLLIQWAALRVDGYFPLNSCLAQSVLPLNFVSKIKQFLTYFCKPHYCIYCGFLCAEEPCRSHKDPRVCAARLWLDTGSVGEEAVTGRGKLCSLFTWLSYFLGLKQTLLECSSWYLLSDPVECLGYFCFSFRAKKAAFGSKSQVASLRLSHCALGRGELSWCGETGTLSSTEHSCCAWSWMC